MIEYTPALTNRLANTDLAPLRDDEETLVADGRAVLPPSQHVEQKLLRLLRASPVPISQVQRRLRPGAR